MKEIKQKEFVVYRIYHIDTGKSYIGITGDYKKRMKEHFYFSGSCRYLHNAIQKHGKEKFITEIIFECDSFEEAKKEEKEYIKVFDTISPNGYNLTKGGDGTLGRECLEETRKKISNAKKGKKGKKRSKETRKKIGEGNKGKKCSDETRKRMSIVAKNRSKEVRKNMADAQKGKKQSKETCKKRSESLRTFSKNQILEIRKMLSDGIIYKIIAKQFDVHQTTIGGIKRNEFYADIQLSEN